MDVVDAGPGCGPDVTRGAAVACADVVVCNPDVAG